MNLRGWLFGLSPWRIIEFWYDNLSDWRFHVLLWETDLILIFLSTVLIKITHVFVVTSSLPSVRWLREISWKLLSLSTVSILAPSRSILI